MRYELFQTLVASFFLLGTDDPPTDCFSIGGRLALKELPRQPIPFQKPAIRLLQINTSLLIRIDARLVFFSTLVGFEARGLHQPPLDQHLGALEVDAAPDAARLARREANGVAEFINAFPDAIDPAEAKGFIDRLGPGHAGLARAYLVEADQQFA